MGEWNVKIYTGLFHYNACHSPEREGISPPIHHHNATMSGDVVLSHRRLKGSRHPQIDRQYRYCESDSNLSNRACLSHFKSGPFASELGIS